MTRVELRHQLNKVTMKQDADPATLFEQLSAIENRYNTASRKIKEEDLIAVVIDAAPEQYQSLLTNEQLRLQNNLKLEDLSKAMNALWQTKDEYEIILGAFEGFCFRCKQKGHKAHECPEKKGRMTSPLGVGGAKGGMGQFKCNHCGKSGHKYADCWQRDENASKRPQNYRMPAKQAQANVNKKTKEKTIEYLMAGITFTTGHKILIDPNVWITDTAATVHTTPYSQGMKNCKKATDDDAITVGNGSKELAPQIANKQAQSTTKKETS
jgi:hypothetical protein